MLPVSYLRGDIARAAHIEDKQVALAGLQWRLTSPGHYVAEVTDGTYHLVKVDSGSRVSRHRYRWHSYWLPSSGESATEIALERSKDWAKMAAVSHWGRTQ